MMKKIIEIPSGKSLYLGISSFLKHMAGPRWQASILHLLHHMQALLDGRISYYKIVRLLFIAAEGCREVSSSLDIAEAIM